MTIIEPLFDADRSAVSGQVASIESADGPPHCVVVTTREERRPSRYAPELDDRKMRALSKTCDAKLDPPAQAAPQASRPCSRHERKACTWLQRRLLRSRHEPVTHLAWSLSAECTMAAKVLVPDNISVELALESNEVHRHEDFSEALLLHRPPKPLDDRDRAVLADFAETRLRSVPDAPHSILVAELRALIGDDVRRSAPGALDGGMEQRAYRGRARFLAKRPSCDAAKSVSGTPTAVGGQI